MPGLPNSKTLDYAISDSGYFNDLVCYDNPRTLTDVKASTYCQVLNILEHTLRSTVELAVIICK